MGFLDMVGSMVGLNGGNAGGAGLNYNASAANTLQPTNIGQTDTSYGQAQQGIDLQRAFLNSLANQGGIQNQSNVFAQQQALANQLQGVANGTGPNPALQQLQNTTGQNVSNQAALMAGQRGSSANAGLLARQAAQQGANIQQQAVGQGAALSAQQQLAGMSALQGQQNMMGSLAGTQVAQQQGGLQGYNQATQSEQQNLLNSVAQNNATNVGMQSNRNTANAGISQITAQGQAGLIGGAGSALTGLFAAKGGEVPSMQHFDMGGTVQPMGPMSQAARNLQGGSSMLYGSAPSNNTSNDFMQSPMASIPNTNVEETMHQAGNKLGGAGVGGLKKLLGGGSAQAGGADLMGAGDLAAAGAMAASKGAIVPGKAKVSGDSLQNDKVPAMLSPKEIVLPRSVTLSPNAPDKAKAFVEAIMARKGLGKMK